MKKKNGFTLIEFLIIIAILGILAAMLIPTINSARAMAGDTIEIEIVVKKKVEGKDGRIIFFSSELDKGPFATIRDGPDGLGMFSLLEKGGKYKVSMTVYPHRAARINKIIKTISEPLGSSNPSGGLTLDNFNEGVLK